MGQSRIRPHYKTMKKMNKVIRNHLCQPEEIALKAYFLGPQAENASFMANQSAKILSEYCHWRRRQFPFDGRAISEADKESLEFLKKENELSECLDYLRRRFQSELPQFSPRYMGHMYSELSLPGILGHWTALLHNPNNISRESSQVGIEIESEAIDFLCQMLKWPKGTGHFTSGGSIANLEACLRMRENINPDENVNEAKLILSASAHYSWRKALKIIGLGSKNLLELPLDKNGHLSLMHFERTLRRLKKNRTPILGLVSLFGSTELGSVDDIHSLQEIIGTEKKMIWHHVDAAYGGYFASTFGAASDYLQRQIVALRKVNSLTLDPHKLGYVPYGCGAFLCRKTEFYHYSNMEIPYIQFTSKADRGLQTIEGSRSATGPTATWLIAKTMGLNKNGMGLLLNRHLGVKNFLQKTMQNSLDNFIPVPGLDLNILCWTIKTKGGSLAAANKMLQKIFRKLPRQERPYFIAKTSMELNRHDWLKRYLKIKGFKIDTDNFELLRMTLMNPFSLSKESETRFIQDFVVSVDRVVRNPKIRTKKSSLQKLSD